MHAVEPIACRSVEIPLEPFAIKKEHRGSGVALIGVLAVPVLKDVPQDG